MKWIGLLNNAMFLDEHGFEDNSWKIVDVGQLVDQKVNIWPKSIVDWELGVLCVM